MKYNIFLNSISKRIIKVYQKRQKAHDILLETDKELDDILSDCVMKCSKLLKESAKK